MNYLPDRKVWAGGLSGIAAWGILTGLGNAGIHPPIDATTLAAAIGWAAAWVTPPSVQDIVSRVNNDIVKLAQDDPTNPTTKP